MQLAYPGGILTVSVACGQNSSAGLVIIVDGFLCCSVGSSHATSQGLLVGKGTRRDFGKLSAEETVEGLTAPPHST